MIKFFSAIKNCFYHEYEGDEVTWPSELAVSYVVVAEGRKKWAPLENKQHVFALYGRGSQHVQPSWTGYKKNSPECYNSLTTTETLAEFLSCNLNCAVTMSVASISLLSVVAVLCSMFAVSASTPTGLRLDSFSEDQVKGCYIHNQTLGVCFELEKDSMKITKTNGEQVVFYTKLDHDLLYYQILDQGFIGWVFLNLNLIRFATAQTIHFAVKLNSPVARVVPRRFSTFEIIPLI